MNASKIICALAALGLFAACSSTPASTTGTVITDAVDAAGDAQTADGTPDVLAADTLPAPDGSLSDTAPADVPAAKYGTCVAVSDCVALSCGATPTAGCEKACLADAGQAALEKAVPMLTCIQDKCQKGQCKDSADPKCVSNCIGQMCTPELIGCIDEGKSGTAVCGDALGCFDKCDSKGGYFSCMSTCYGELGTAGKTALAIYAQCAGKAAGLGQAPEQACISELMSCMTGGKTGTKGCHEIFACQGACPSGEDLGCMAKCLSDTTAAGQKAFVDAMPCFGKQDVMTDPVCSAKFMACINPSGTKTCAQTLACQNACPQAPPGQDNGPACGFSCMHDASPAAAEAFLKIGPCGIENKTPEQAQACTDAMILCANPSGTDNCKQILACAMGCGQNSGSDCVFGCVGKGSKEGAAAFGKFIACKDGCDLQCKGSADPDCSGKCVSNKCPADLAACSPAT